MINNNKKENKMRNEIPYRGNMTEEELMRISDRNLKEREEEEMRELEHSKNSSYRGWFEIDRERIEKNIVGRKLTDDEWNDLCWEFDEMSEGERENLIMENTIYGMDYIQKNGHTWY